MKQSADDKHAPVILWMLLGSWWALQKLELHSAVIFLIFPHAEQPPVYIHNSTDAS